MNTKRYKYIIAFVLAFIALPIMAQDYMEIHFKDGTYRKFCLKNVIEFVPTKYDSNGTLYNDFIYQRVVTNDDTFVYLLSDVDSISFTKYDETKAKENFVDAAVGFFRIMSKKDSSTDIDEIIEETKKVKGVEDVWGDSHQLFVKVEGFGVVPFHFSHEPSTEKKAMSRMMDNLSSSNAFIKSDGSQLKAVIANQSYYDDRFSNDIEKNYIPLQKHLEQCSIKVNYIKRPTIDFFLQNSSTPDELKSLNLYDYDIVLLDTHGGYDEITGIHEFMTGEIIGLRDMNDYAKDEELLKADLSDVHIQWSQIRKKYDCEYGNYIGFSFSEEHYVYGDNVNKKWVFHPTLTEDFFRYKALGEFKNKNSIMFNCACLSLKGKNDQPSFSFADVFFEKRRLGIYAGYTENAYFSPTAGRDFFNSMLWGYSVGRSFDDLNEWCKKETIDNIDNNLESFLDCYGQEELDDLRKGEWKPEGAELKIIDKSGSMPSDFFLFPTITSELDEELVTQDYLSNQSVTVNGSATLRGESELVFGFKYATNPYVLNQEVEAEEVVSNDNCNYSFKAKLKNLEPDKTYYYRAYTYDGMYYNYGEKCSFTTPKITPVIEDLHIDAASMELIIGESKSITITSGNGDYTVKSSNERVATASINGTTVTVKAISTGSKVVITVIDSKSGQTATVYVTVTEVITPIDNPEDVIDLGLPSGMLWASCNLGATKPEEIGEYYAWGEISPNWYDASGQYSMDVSHSGMGLRWDMTKYCTKEKYGTVDNKISLDLKDDVVHVVLKGRYRMPSWQDYEELITNCTTEWTALNGVNGCQFKGPNGKTIFFPATGVWMYGDLEHLDSYCNYWSRSLYTKLPYKASILCAFDESVWGGGDPVCVHREERYKCKPIRAVMLPEGSPSNLVDFALSGNVNPIIGLGEKCKLNVVSGNGSYTSSSKHPSIANVSINNNVIEITGQHPGTTIIYITDKCSGQDIMVTVTVTPKTETPAAAVDLGLPSGTKWASYNLGATRPEDYGGYYAWGELEKKDSYSWNTYLHCDGEDYSCYELPNDISGTVYDIVKMKWGGSWRMPTVDDFYELSKNCQIEWVSRSGTKGCLITGPNGNSIFLPASGWVDGETKKNVNEYGLFWTPCLIDYNTDYGKSLGGSLDEIGVGGAIGDRYAGYSIRPVIK